MNVIPPPHHDATIEAFGSLALEKIMPSSTEPVWVLLIVILGADGPATNSNEDGAVDPIPMYPCDDCVITETPMDAGPVNTGTELVAPPDDVTAFCAEMRTATIMTAIPSSFDVVCIAVLPFVDAPSSGYRGARVWHSADELLKRH